MRSTWMGILALVAFALPATAAIPEGAVHLQSVENGKFVRAGVTETSLLAATSSHVKGWETFEVIEVPSNAGREDELFMRTYALRSAQSGKYVRAGVGQSSMLAAASDQIGAWEKFNIVELGDGIVYLRSNHSGMVVRAGFQNGTYLAANSPHVQGWEKFRLIPR